VVPSRLWRGPFRSPSPRRGQSLAETRDRSTIEEDPIPATEWRKSLTYENVAASEGTQAEEVTSKGKTKAKSSGSDVDMESVDGRDVCVANDPALPKHPTYRGTTMAERREFMRLYETYCNELSAFETTWNRPFIMPVRLCVDIITLREIAYWGPEKPVEEVNE